MGQSLAKSLSLQPCLQFPNKLLLSPTTTLAVLLLETRKKRIILVVLVAGSHRHRLCHRDIVHLQMDGHLDHLGNLHLCDKLRLLLNIR
jgi:hypothetical protein